MKLAHLFPLFRPQQLFLFIEPVAQPLKSSDVFHIRIDINFFQAGNIGKKAVFSRTHFGHVFIAYLSIGDESGHDIFRFNLGNTSQCCRGIAHFFFAPFDGHFLTVVVDEPPDDVVHFFFPGKVQTDDEAMALQRVPDGFIGQDDQAGTVFDCQIDYIEEALGIGRITADIRNFCQYQRLIVPVLGPHHIGREIKR